MYGIVCTIQDITSSLYDLRPLCLCHHTHYIWHPVHCICGITFTVLMISQQLYFWDHIRYNTHHHIHCIWHDIHWICVITHTRLMISHPFYVWHHTHYMYNTIYTLCGITTIFYEITSHYLCDRMHCIHVITPTVSNTASTVSVSSQPLYIWSLNNCMYDIIPTIYMAPYAPYITSHPLFEFTPL